MAAEEDEPLRWSAVAAVFGTGMLLTAVAIYTSVALGWQGIWPEVLLGWGTTIALGAVLFAVQRTFVGDVRAQTKAAVDEAADRLTTKVSDLERRLGERLASPEEAVSVSEEITADRRGVQDSLIEDMRTRASRETFTKPLVKAAELNAIDFYHGFHVRASRAVDGLRLGVVLDHDRPDRERKRDKPERDKPEPKWFRRVALWLPHGDGREQQLAEDRYGHDGEPETTMRRSTRALTSNGNPASRCRSYSPTSTTRSATSEFESVASTLTASSSSTTSLQVSTWRGSIETRGRPRCQFAHRANRRSVRAHDLRSRVTHLGLHHLGNGVPAAPGG